MITESDLKMEGCGERKSASVGGGPPAESITSITSHRRKRLTRSENVSCCHHHSGWEAIFRESLLHMAWPISLSMSTDNEHGIIDDFLPLKIRSVEQRNTLLVASLVRVWVSRDTTVWRTIFRAVLEQFFFRSVFF